MRLGRDFTATYIRESAAGPIYVRQAYNMTLESAEALFTIGRLRGDHMPNLAAAS